MRRRIQQIIRAFLVGALVYVLGGHEVVAQPTFRTVSSQLNQASIGIGNHIDAASAVDFNQDGFIDIFRFGHFYVNEGDAHFRDKRVLTGIRAPHERQAGGLWGDFNNDGLLDVALLSRASGVTFYRNVGQDRLTEVERTISGTTLRGEAGLWADFDGDGWLDLFVAGDGEVAVYWNEGGLQFQETRWTLPTTRLCSASGADYDDDNDVDVFLGACREDEGVRTNVLLRNEGGRTFADVTTEIGLVDAFENQDTEVGLWLDYDNDGWWDIVILRKGTGFQAEDRGGLVLFRNDQQGAFIEVTQEAGLNSGRLWTHTGGVIGDFNNDGWVDLFFSSPSATHSDTYFHNNGDGTFSEHFISLRSSRSSAVVGSDFNHDGWLDLWTNDLTKDNLFLNLPSASYWLQVKLVGTESNRFGIGANIKVYASGRQQMRQIAAGAGGASQSFNATAYVGLDTTAVVDSVVVQWPSGRVDRILDLAANQVLTVVEGEGLNPAPAVTLQEPSNDEQLATDLDEVVFRWMATDAQQDRLRHTLFLRSAAVDTVVTGLPINEARLPATLLQTGGVFEWSVHVTDGFSVKQSRLSRFRVVPDRPPALYNIQFPLSVYERGTIALGDLGGDRDLDFAATGWTQDGDAITAVYRLDDESFTETIGESTFVHDTKVYTLAVTLPGVVDGGLEWVDADGDGSDELFAHGLTGSRAAPRPSATLLDNLEGVIVRQRSFAAVSHSLAAWGDYDSDGDLDVVLAGATTQDPPGNPRTYLYRNEGFRFVEVPTDLPGLMHGAAAWGDIDNDGALDLAVMGDIGQGRLVSRIYRGDQEGRFTEVPTPMVGLAFGSLAWADYDLDGDVDLLQAGGRLDAANLVRGTTRLYRNEGGRLVDTQQVFNSAFQGTATWGDYDADGDPDIVLQGSGHAFGERTARIYINHNGQFASDPQARFEGGLEARVQVGDYNGDGDLDVLFFKKNHDGRSILSFYINCQFVEEVYPEYLPVGLTGTPIKACSGV